MQPVLEQYFCNSNLRTLSFTFSSNDKFTSSLVSLVVKNSEIETSRTFAHFSSVETDGSTLPLSIRLYCPCGMPKPVWISVLYLKTNWIVKYIMSLEKHFRLMLKRFQNYWKIDNLYFLTLIFLHNYIVPHIEYCRVTVAINRKLF